MHALRSQVKLHTLKSDNRFLLRISSSCISSEKPDDKSVHRLSKRDFLKRGPNPVLEEEGRSPGSDKTGLGLAPALRAAPSLLPISPFEGVSLLILKNLSFYPDLISRRLSGLYFVLPPLLENSKTLISQVILHIQGKSKKI